MIQQRYKQGFFVSITAITVISSWLYLSPDLSSLHDGLTNLTILAKEAFPPTLDLLPTAFKAVLETLTIAVLGTFFGFLLALPFGFMGAKTLAPRPLFLMTRTLCAAIRTMPSLLWAVLFVIIIGFQPLAGILAMTFYTMGHLAKLQYESIEGLAPEPIEAIKATGAGFFKLSRFVVLPLAANDLVSQVLYMFEYNVRASSIIGFVGAGGIGFYIQRYLQMLQYDGVVTLLLAVFITILAIDALSLRIRARFLGKLPGHS